MSVDSHVLLLQEQCWLLNLASTELTCKLLSETLLAVFLAGQEWKVGCIGPSKVV